MGRFWNLKKTVYFRSDYISKSLQDEEAYAFSFFFNIYTYIPEFDPLVDLFFVNRHVFC